MFAIASHQSSQQAAAQDWSLALHLLCLAPRNLLDDFYAFSD